MSYIPPRMPQGAQQQGVSSADLHFNNIIGDLPFRDPNVRSGYEAVDLPLTVPVASGGNFCLSGLLCMIPVIGCCYVYRKSGLIEEGRYGLALDNGRPKLLLPGYYTLPSCFATKMLDVSSGDNTIRMGPVSIVRIPSGAYGFATNNGVYEILTPGLHARNQGSWKFLELKSLGEDLIQQGPIKLLTVRSGTVRICYRQGKVAIYAVSRREKRRNEEGRYAINDATFNVGSIVATTQQNVRFEQHTVLLDGGISMLVEGLLTYQVLDVERLVKELGERDLARTIQDVTKAELARVFAAIHLEQISSTHAGKNIAAPSPAKVKQSSAGSSSSPGTIAAAPGAGEYDSLDGGAPEDVVSRSKICEDVISYTQPLVTAWGVKICNFQLESTKIADASYAREYEEASLGMAKAKANLRSVEAENDIMLQRARAAANATRIEAEGKGQAVIIQAQSLADARKIEAIARNDAAEAMSDEFARQYALGSVQVEWASALKANVLTIVPSGVVGQPLMSITGQPLIPAARMQ